MDQELARRSLHSLRRPLCSSWPLCWKPQRPRGVRLSVEDGRHIGFGANCKFGFLQLICVAMTWQTVPGGTFDDTISVEAGNALFPVLSSLKFRSKRNVSGPVIGAALAFVSVTSHPHDLVARHFTGVATIAVFSPLPSS